jgi:hypothetical protein
MRGRFCYGRFRMSYLALSWVVVGVVIALWLYLAWRHRDARLDRLSLKEGEELCFDDEEARFAAVGKNRHTGKAPSFRRAVVRLTSERLIVAEPMGPITRMRWAVYHRGVLPDAVGNAWTDGYVSFATSPAHISVQLEANKRCLRIRPNGETTAGPAPEHLAIESPRLGEYMAVLGRSGEGAGQRRSPG